MHASIWRFAGYPDELLRSYEAMVSEIPAANMQLHLCLRDLDGIVLVDTCPSKEAFDSLFAGERKAERATPGRWAIVDSNHGPPPYQSGALTD
jgi:hypothetical protein